MKKNVILISADNDGYNLEQCGKTLTIGELIDILSSYDEDMPIYLKFDGGYTYGRLSEYRINSRYWEDEEE